MSPEIVEHFTQFGVAGLMGVLWVWERLMSRRRERQLSETHERLMAQREQLSALLDLVKHNTQAVERFEQTQVRLIELIDRMVREIKKSAA
ncbi:MAG: hypothetical protein K8S99_06500 [Planctomycetes bacterium]|nr:hypothetical protein [Planctomycetota bacterium]